MADKFKNLAKGGWHPERNAGSAAGGQSDSKLGQMKGWVGKAQGKNTHAAAAREHQSAPLSSLKDPASFAPPPKRLDYNSGSVASASSSASPVTSAGGLSSAQPSSAKQRLQERREAARADEAEKRASSGPYRADTTGLSTAHLPKPPAFQPNPAPSPPASRVARSVPKLPPRLPPRQNSNPDEHAPLPPPTYTEATGQGMLNQGALTRLGQAGISVPGFGIGQSTSPPVPPRQNSTENAYMSSPTSVTNSQQVNELQSRFSKMATAPTSAAAPTTGTSWADKQAALRTASELRDDPSKVSAADLKGAASTANNFQQRHGEQVASGLRAANGLNQKYGIAGRIGSATSAHSASEPPQSPPAIGKKPPPPPPKRRGLGGGTGEPPPIPLSSKPKF